MEPLVLGLFAAAAVGGQIAANWGRRRALARAWVETARLAGLSEISVDTPYPLPLSVSARAGTRLVRFEAGRWPLRQVPRSFRVATTKLITLRSEGLGTSLEKTVGTSELQIGDEAFDQAVFVKGPPEILRAVLDSQMRSRLQCLVGGLRSGRVAVLDGDVCAEMPDPIEETPSLLAEFLGDIVDLARKLDVPADIPGRIAENTRREREWQVRLRNLQLLWEKYPKSEATREAIAHARGDAHPEVRIKAAMASDEDGIATLLEMAADSSNDEEYAARAVSWLGAALPTEKAVEILDLSLGARRLKTVVVCLDRLAYVGGADLVARFARILAMERGDVGAAAARALGASGGSAAEAPLLEALRKAKDPVTTAAAEALGRVGSAASVLPLKEAADTNRGPLRRAAREAVAQIQSRIQGASPGQVSLAGGEAGQVSLVVENPTGRVSLAQHEKGPAGGMDPDRGSTR
jgi:hypothetical protein